MKSQIRTIGKTELGQSIDCWEFESITSSQRILIIGGVHGDESEGIDLAKAIIKNLIASKEEVKAQIRVIPCLNKDGELLDLRSNYNDIDLNRNIPTQNWTSEYSNTRYKPGQSPSSENETKAFMNVLTSFKPTFIISLHSFSESLVLYNKADGKFDSQVKNLSHNLGIKLVDKMSYQIYGSLNTYCFENMIPAITLEMPRDNSWINRRLLFLEETMTLLKKVSL